VERHLGLPRSGGAVGSASLVLNHLGGRPAQARAELVGDDLDLGPLVAFGRLPTALLEPARHDHSCPSCERLADILRHLAPAHDIEERGGLLPLLGLTVLPTAVDSQPEAGCCLAIRGKAQLRSRVTLPTTVTVFPFAIAYLQFAQLAALIRAALRAAV